MTTASVVLAVVHRCGIWQYRHRPQDHSECEIMTLLIVPVLMKLIKHSIQIKTNILPHDYTFTAKYSLNIINLTI